MLLISSVININPKIQDERSAVLLNHLHGTFLCKERRFDEAIPYLEYALGICKKKEWILDIFVVGSSLSSAYKEGNPGIKKSRQQSDALYELFQQEESKILASQSMLFSSQFLSNYSNTVLNDFTRDKSSYLKNALKSLNLAEKAHDLAMNYQRRFLLDDDGIKKDGGFISNLLLIHQSIGNAKVACADAADGTNTFL